MSKKIILILLIPTFAFAQVSFVGNYTAHVLTDTTVRFYAGTSVIEFRFLRSDIIQVSFFPDSSEIVYEESFVVIQNCTGSLWNLQEESDRFFIETDSVLIRVDKTPLRIYYMIRQESLSSKKEMQGDLVLLEEKNMLFLRFNQTSIFTGLGKKELKLTEKVMHLTLITSTSSDMKPL